MEKIKKDNSGALELSEKEKNERKIIVRSLLKQLGLRVSRKNFINKEVQLFFLYKNIGIIIQHLAPPFEWQDVDTAFSELFRIIVEDHNEVFIYYKDKSKVQTNRKSDKKKDKLIGEWSFNRKTKTMVNIASSAKNTDHA